MQAGEEKVKRRTTSRLSSSPVLLLHCMGVLGDGLWSMDHS